MKILQVLYSGLGGHGNVFFSLITADKNQEFEYEALFNGIEEVRLEYKIKCTQLKVPFTFIKKNPGIDLTYLNNFFKTLKKSNAEIFFLHSSMYLLPATLANLFSSKKKKIIIRETQANNLKTGKEWIWLSAAFLFADEIVFLSEEYKQEVKQKIPSFYKEKKVSVIPNGIDLTIFHPGIKTKKGYINIGMQSRLADNKDHPTLLKALVILKGLGYPVRLKIAGDGNCRSNLMALSQKLLIENDVEFSGMLQEDDLVTFLHELDMYVHASFGETMSTAIMQAMACGLPVIASNVPGINNMITHNVTGMLVPVKNEQLMADAIIYLLNNEPLLKQLGENAFEFAKTHYANVTMFKKYKELFTS